MRLLSLSTADDRGQRRRLASPRGLPRGPVKSVLSLPQVGWIFAGTTVFNVVAVGMTLLTMRKSRRLLAVAGMPASAHPGISPVVLAFLVGGPLALLALYLACRPFVSWLVARQVLARDCCPACAYSLAALEPEGDGCRVCPECGAAWSLP